MGTQARAREIAVDEWLGTGGQVLAANDRAARAVAAAFDAARAAEGRRAWRSAAVFAWDAWVKERWQERNSDGLVLLNSLQEQALWGKVIRASDAGAGLLQVDRLAAAAMQAHRLLCDFASEALAGSARTGWPGDAAVFSGWLAEFDARCRREGLVSASRLVLDLREKLSREPRTAARAPLLLIGFDRLLETQRGLLDAWGEWATESGAERAQSCQFWVAEDTSAEVRACVQWLRSALEADPKARLMLLVPGLEERRGELERALLSEGNSTGTRLDFEFSLGVPLDRVGAVRSAVLLLRWLEGPLLEPEVDWLIGCGHTVASGAEELALAEAMAALRENGQERPAWGLQEFCRCLAGSRGPEHGLAPTSVEWWAERLLAVQEKLRAEKKKQSPREWARVAEELLEIAGWPGFRPESSVVYQARRRWEKVLEDCASLGLDGALVEFGEFVGTVSAAAVGTIFAAESRGAPILITEPLASAGQLADGVWFLGADEDRWPGRGQPHPLLPVGLQREAVMPHGSPQADWDVAQGATLRMLAVADEVVFSYPRRAAETEARPSRLVLPLVGAPEELPEAEAGLTAEREPLTECYADLSRIGFPRKELRRGAAVLTSQSVCPFRAFATARLGTNDWEPAETGLNAKQRGVLLHAVLRRVWAGAAEGGIGSLEDLKAIGDLREFVAARVRLAMRESFDTARRNAIPARFGERYLELEARRLVELVTEWLAFELGRQRFEVEGVEVKREIVIAGLKMQVRMDRVDVLEDGSRLILDYKSGMVAPSAWVGERPEDLQLPLYAAFAIEQVGGLVFGRIRPGKAEFCGRVRDAQGTLLAGLHGTNGLVKDPLNDAQLEDWRERIERLGEDFVTGKAEVNPKEVGKTCQTCQLHALCRIDESQEFAAAIAEEDDSDDESGGGDG